MSAAYYIETMQHAIRSLLPLAVVLILGLLFMIIPAVFARHDRPIFYLSIVASACLIAAILVTIFGNWPINNQIIKWDINSPPHFDAFESQVGAFGCPLIELLPESAKHI
jgi:hypothetical protein